MKDAVRFFTIAFGILIGIILVLYNYSDFLSSMLFGEILIIGTYTFLLGVVVISIFQKKITANHVRIRLKKLNWIPLAIWLTLGLLTISQGFRYPDLGDELFGFIHEKTAMGIGFIMLGLFQMSRTIVMDKKGLKTNDLLNSKFEYSELKNFNIQLDSIEFQTETKKYRYKIYKLTESEILEIKDRIENLTKSTIAQQCV